MSELTKSNVFGVFGKIPVSTLAVSGLYIIVLIVGVINGFTFTRLISDSLHLFGVWAILVLANVPSIQSGIGPNFALPIGVVSGLLAMVLVLSLNLMGVVFLIVATLVAIVIGSATGYLYGRLMNAAKGSEMAIAPYTGFAITALFSLVWLALPIRHTHMVFFLGDGLRHQIMLENWNANALLSNFLSFQIFDLEVRTGELMVVFAACFLMWMFFRTKTGIAMSAVGRNPMFAKAAGINVDRSRILANMISTAVAAVGVVVYAQGFGFVQLYDFPMMMAFPAVACILVGGATGQRAKVTNVIVGAILFQGLLAIALPVFTRVIAGTDVDGLDGVVNQIRMIIQNGIILYALSLMSKGGK